LKRFGLFLLFFIFLSSAVWGADYYWNGSDDNKWNKYENWDKGSPGTPATTGEYPGSASGDTATINSGTVEIEASDNITITSLTINGGTLTIDSAGSLTTTNITIDDGTLTNNGSLTVTNVTITSTNGTISNLDIGSGDVSITTTGSSNVTIGTITTSGTIDLTVGGTGTLNAGINSYNTVTINANTTLASNLSTGNLTINSGVSTEAGAISVSGDFELNGGSLNAASLAVTGTSTIGGDITTTGNTQNYGGDVTLGNNVTLTGSTVTLGAITGGNHSLTITGDAVFSGGISGINALFVSGTASINGDITTSGNQEYHGAVTLGGVGPLYDLTGTTVTIIGAVTGNSNSLKITGDAVLNAVNGLTDLTVIGTAELNADITTGGDQSYGGAVTITGTQTLKTTGGTITTTGLVTATAGVTIDASGGITIGSGGINAGTVGVVKLESGGNITISGNVTGHQLLAIAPTDHTVTIGAVIQTNSNGTEGSGVSGASIYVSAGTFVVSNGASIIPGTAGRLCLNLVDTWTDANSAVAENRWHQHYHMPTTKNLVYGTGPNSGLYLDGDGNNIPNVFYVDSTDPNIHNDEFSVAGSSNIYIINVGTTSKEVTFEVTGSGIIEIQGNYSSSSNLTLEPGAGGIRLAGANITLTGNFDTDTADITLKGDNSITAAKVTLGGTVSGVGDFSVTSAAIEIRGNVSTTGGSQTYNGHVTLGAGVTLTGSTVTLDAITGGSHALTINGNAVLNGGGSGIGALHITGTAEIKAAITATAGVSVDGTSVINANITTTGTQTYTGAVTLGANITLTGSTVTLGAITGVNHSLTVTGNAVLNGGSDIGALHITGTGTINAAITATASVYVEGTSTISADITTTGAQSYTGAVTLSGGDRTLTGTTVTLGAITGGNHSLTVAGNAVFNGGGSGINALSVTGTASINGDITTSGNQSYAVAVTITGMRTLKSTGGTITTTGHVTASAGVTIEAGGITIGGGITASTSATGVIRLESTGVNADIDINGNIHGYQLLAKASGKVTIDASVTIETSSTGSHFESASIYVNAKTFVVSNSASIIPGSTGQLCLMVEDTFDDNLVDTIVSGRRWHQHKDKTMSANVVYSSEPDAPDFFKDENGDDILGYQYINSTDPDYKDALIRVPTGFNIYIIDVGNNAPGVTFIKEGSGFIEIQGSYITSSSSSNLTLQPGIDGIKLVDANIVLTDSDFDTDGKKVELIGSNGNSISAANIKLGAVSGTGTGDFSVTGAAIDISGDVSIDGDQTYHGAVTLSGGNRSLASTATGGKITISTGLFSAAGNVIIHADGGIFTGSGGLEADNGSIAITGTVTALSNNSVTIKANGITTEGITASTGTSGIIRLESTGNIAINGDIEGYQLLAIAPSGNVTVGDKIETHSNGNEGESASIYVDAKIFDVSHSTPNSIIPGSTGQLCLYLTDEWTPSANTIVSGGRFHQHYYMPTIAHNLVYGTGSNPGPYTDGNGIPILDAVYVDSTSTAILNDVFTVSANFNIYINNVGTTSREVTFKVTGGGFIEIQGNYTSSSNLTLEPGTGGIRLSNANITLTGKDFDTDAAALTLRGTGNSITAANVILGGTVTGNSNFTVKATSGNIATAGINTGNTATNGRIRLESGGDITVGGTVTGYQLLAIAPSGSVTVGSVVIDPGNTGEEGEDAAIYISANQFNVTVTTGDSIVPGGGNGQLCLMLNTDWTDNHSVVQGGRWHQDHTPKTVQILYSFTEDANGDGRLDRIRVQASVALYGDFSSFDVSVASYEIDRSKGDNGFEKVSNNSDSFYIYLKQKSELDGGSTPQWSVTLNSSLKDSTGNSFIGVPSIDINITPTDTIPPRIAYTLTLPGYPQTYVQMSEPVDSTAADLVNSFEGMTPITGASSADSLGLGYVLDLTAPIGVNTLVGLNITNGSPTIGYLSVKNIVDRSTPPNIVDGIAPKYPADWGYTAYATTSISFPHSLIDNTKALSSITPAYSPTPVIRRVTDVLVSIPPDSVNVNYFAWPVYAKNEKGTIGVFDGTASLEDGETDIELQARLNLLGNLRLFWKATSRGNSNALWQPFSSQYYFAPDGEAVMLSGTPVPPSNLFNYSFPNIDSGNRVEFYLYIGSSTPNTDQFIARLDIKSGAAIPSNWYNLVRPFCFDVQGVRRQRGGVTVRNNVINSDAREEVTILYNIARPGRVTIQVYTLEGTLVKSLMRNEYREAGEFDVKWNGSNNAGRAVARGMYFVRVVGPDIDEIRKIMVIR